MASEETARRRRRNPVWERDELILALDLYLRRGLLDDTAPEVVELSTVLNALPLSADRAGDERYRNVNGVAMKLGNFARFDPSYGGAGLSRGGRREEEIWNTYANDRETLGRIAAELREMAAQPAIAPAPDPHDADGEAVEGRLLFRRHLARERNRGLAQRKKDQMRAAKGRLECEICGLDPVSFYGSLGEAVLEVHHKRPRGIVKCCGLAAVR